jgi:hypothetical protein
MATMKGLIQHTSGIPLGGIGTGSIEIRPDGYFHEWQIFNLGAWAPRQPECCRTEGPPMPPGALALHVWAKQGGAAPVVRRLGVRSDQHDMYNLAWLKSVREIEFTGRFPAATLRYLDDDLPVSVVARVFSPFVPHDSETSGTPGFYAVFRVKNTSPEPVEVSLAAVLRNPLAWGAEDRQLKNTISRDGAATLLTMRTCAKAACQATLGSLGLSVTGGKASWMAGEFADYVSGTHIWDDGYGIVHECFLHGFRATGRLPSLPGNQSPATLVLLKDDQIDELPPAEKKRLVKALLRYPFARALYDRVAFVDRKHLAGDAGLGTFLKAIRRRLDRMAGQDRRRQAWGDGALASTVTLAPQEEKEIAFTLGWHFPHHFSERGPVLGHMYANWFADAEEVNRFLAAHREGIQARALGFADALHETTLDPILADAWAGQLTTLAKCTWWTKAGDVAVSRGPRLLRLPHHRHHVPGLVQHPRALSGPPEAADGARGEVPAGRRSRAPLLHARPLGRRQRLRPRRHEPAVRAPDGPRLPVDGRPGAPAPPVAARGPRDGEHRASRCRRRRPARPRHPAQHVRRVELLRHALVHREPVALGPAGGGAPGRGPRPEGPGRAVAQGPAPGHRLVRG